MLNRVLINSRFGVSYSNFSFLTPIRIDPFSDGDRKFLTFWKVSIEKYDKTPTFYGRQHFTPIFKILVRTLLNSLTIAMLNKLECHAHFLFSANQIPCPLFIFSQSDYLIVVVLQIHILNAKKSVNPDHLDSTYLDLHCLQRQSISRFSRSRVNSSIYFFFLIHYINKSV